MHVRFDSPAGLSVPDPERTLQEIHDQLAAQHTIGAVKLGRDPACLAELDPQGHAAFQQFADRLMASLRAQPGQPPELAMQAKKKSRRPHGRCVRRRSVR